MEEEHHGVVLQKVALVHLVVLERARQLQGVLKLTVGQREDEKRQLRHPESTYPDKNHSTSLFSPAQRHGSVSKLVKMSGLPSKALNGVTTWTVLGQVERSDQTELVLQVVNPDHALQQVLGLLQVTILGHEDEIFFPEEEGGREEASGIEGGEVEAVEEGGRLALVPLPDEDVVEALADVVLDGHEVLLIPVSEIRAVILNVILRIEIGRG